MIIKPKGKLAALTDPSQKIFEGEVTSTLYDDRLVSEGYCWHCKSKVTLELELSKSEAKQSVYDDQFRINLIELEKDRMQELHQCGALLYDGKDDVEELGRRLQRGY